MGLSKKPLSKEQYIELIDLYAPTIEGLTKARVLEMINEKSDEIILSTEEKDNVILELIEANEQKSTKIQKGFYIGNGNKGISYPNTLTFDFEPKYIAISCKESSIYNSYGFGVNGGCIIGITYSGDLSIVEAFPLETTYSNNTVSWYCPDGIASGTTRQLNSSGTYYYYVAIG